MTEWQELPVDVDALVQMQQHRDAWREYAYGNREKPTDFLDGNKVNRPPTALERGQPAPAACEWWLVLAGDGDVLEVFAFEDDAHRWATEQDAAIVDGPPHCVVRVVSAGSEPVAEREQPGVAELWEGEPDQGVKRRYALNAAAMLRELLRERDEERALTAVARQREKP